MGVVIYKRVSGFGTKKMRGLLLIGNKDSTYAIDQEYDSSKVKVARIHQTYCKIW